MAAVQAYPVRVDASLDAPLSRWLWLVKWVLVIPHYIVLAFLWAAFIVLSVVAMVAIVFTGRYPRAIFEFNVGVLRWTWRVQYYAIGAFGTDRYPPFTLADDPSYPAHLEIDYPQRLSRGLALVKWWLLAIPHYIIVGLFTGSGLWAAWQYGEQQHGWANLGLIGILTVIAAVVLLVTGRYPQQIFDFVLGLNRWVLRVAGYAALMTDRYPPFRLDMGGHDPGTLTLPPASPPPEVPGSQALSQAAGHQVLPQAAGSQDSPQVAPWQQEPPRRPGGWTGSRIVAVVAGAVLVLCSAGLFGGGGVALWAQANRHGGYADLGTVSYTVPGYAIASDTIGLHEATGLVQHVIGTVRISVTQGNRTAPVFVGIAPASAAARYLAGVDYATVRGVAAHHGTYTEHAGSAPTIRPAQAHIWAAQATGPGTQTLTWAMRSGDWMVVAMNADASRPVSLQANVAATLPALPWIAAGLLIGGFVLLAGGALLIAVPARRASAPDEHP
jgi:Domain of unknown function (DUF4389)